MQLSYYDSNADSKLHGTIALKDILGVTEAEPQVVPALKPGESSFFFNVRMAPLLSLYWEYTEGYTGSILKWEILKVILELY